MATAPKEPTLKQVMASANKQLADAAAQNMQPDPDRAPKMGFPFDLQSRRPKPTSTGISGDVKSAKP
jgi:hypothetical protein